MQKKLKSCGTGWEFYFTKPMLQLLGYAPEDTQLLITTSNRILYVEPVTDLETYKNNMVKPLHKSGYSYALYFTQPLIEILELNPEEDALDIEVDGNKLIIKKA